MSTSAELFSRAWQHHQANQLQEAEQLYRFVVANDPQHADAWCFLGALCYSLGRLEEAEACLRRALEIVPSYTTAFNYLSMVQVGRGQLDGAAATLQYLVETQPDAAEGWNNLASIRLQQNRLAEAASHYGRALALAPERVDFVNNLSNLANRFGAQGDLDSAIACFRQVVSCRPDFPGAQNNLGAALAQQGHFDEAQACCREAIRLDPHFAEAHYNLGNMLASLGQLDDAIACFHNSVRLKADYVDAYRNLGLAFARQHRFAEAEDCYQRAIQIQPDNAEVHFPLADLLLLQGDFHRGWPEYEWRWHRACAEVRPSTLPRWDGVPLEGRTILLYAEQGLGDTIQFLRYAPLVKQRGGSVVVECQPALLSLAETCPGIDLLVPRGAIAPACDVECPLLSLPGIFGTHLGNIPTDIPYLSADKERTEWWRQELVALAPARARRKVGIVWQGSPTFGKDRQRSVPLTQFAPLAEVPGVALFSLQVGKGSEQLATAGVPAIDLGNRFDRSSLADLAAVLMNLDLLITVDTAPAHLAGALGMPVWLALPALPDWRWLLGREDSPWYPSVRLFRQPQEGNWDAVFARMAEELGRVLDA